MKEKKRPLKMMKTYTLSAITGEAKARISKRVSNIIKGKKKITTQIVSENASIQK